MIIEEKNTGNKWKTVIHETPSQIKKNPKPFKLTLNSSELKKAKEAQKYIQERLRIT